MVDSGIGMFDNRGNYTGDNWIQSCKSCFDESGEKFEDGVGRGIHFIIAKKDSKSMTVSFGNSIDLKK